MDMVGHQTIGPTRHPVGSATLGQEIAIKHVVASLDKQLLSPIATLSDMVRQVGDHDAGEASHRTRMAETSQKCN
jgi:hypothetical protein